jgi:hypothetical protein
MSVEKVNLADGLSLLRHLLERAESAEGGNGWFDTLGKTTLRPGERAVMAILATKAGAAEAGLPLIERPDGTLHALTAPYTTRYAPPLGTAATAERLGRGLRRIVPGRLTLDGLDPADPAIIGLLSGVRAGGLLSADYRNFANWHDRIVDFDSYWSQRPSELKAVVRRKGRRLEREGSLRFACFTAVEDMPDAIAAYEGIYVQSWKEPEPDPDFIGTMAHALAAEGAVRLGIAYIDDAAVAAQIWLVRHRCATIFKVAHIAGQDRNSPGTLLTHWLMHRLVQTDAIETVDFGRGNDPYKRQWMSLCQDRTGIIIANPRSLNGLGTAFRHIWPMQLRRLLNGAR